VCGDDARSAAPRIPRHLCSVRESGSPRTLTGSHLHTYTWPVTPTCTHTLPGTHTHDTHTSTWPLTHTLSPTHTPTHIATHSHTGTHTLTLTHTNIFRIVYKKACNCLLRFTVHIEC